MPRKNKDLRFTEDDINDVEPHKDGSITIYIETEEHESVEITLSRYYVQRLASKCISALGGY